MPDTAVVARSPHDGRYYLRVALDREADASTWRLLPGLMEADARRAARAQGFARTTVVVWPAAPHTWSTTA